MSGGDLKVSVSGGNVNIGNLSQGDSNALHSGPQTIEARFDQAFGAVLARLDEHARQGADAREVAALRSELAVLKQQLAQQSEPAPSLMEKAKVLYERFAWAGDALQKLYRTVLPMLTL